MGGKKIDKYKYLIKYTLNMDKKLRTLSCTVISFKAPEDFIKFFPGYYKVAHKRIRSMQIYTPEGRELSPLIMV